MTITYPIVEFGRNAILIAEDATFSCPDVQSFAILDDLALPNTTRKPFATYEPDFWLLDGNYHFKPDTPVHVGLMSASMSDASSEFPVPPVLTITFSTVHSTNGLTFYFSKFTDDYCGVITVAFYDASNALIRSDNYVGALGTEFSTNQAAANFKKIVITFTETHKPYRYLRLLSMGFDNLTIFSGTQVKAARVVEQINPIAVELPSNTVELSLFSADGDFSIVDPAGFYANLQYKEPLDVYENIDGAPIYIGRFYLDKWESQSENLATFQASDAITLLDGVDYFPEATSGHPIDPLNPYATVLSEDLIEDLFTQAGLSYTLDASLAGVAIKTFGQPSGWVPVMSCRKVLQQILFSLRAYATCARGNVVQILPTELASGLSVYDFTIPATSKGMGGNVKLRPLVTGVELTSHDLWWDGQAAQQILSVELATGTHIVTYNEPHLDVVASSGTTVVTWGSTWFELNVTVAGTKTFTGKSYRDSQLKHSVYGSPPVGTPSNIVKIEDATLVINSAAAAITQQIYDYLQQRYELNTKLYASLVAVGDSVLIDTQATKQIKGIIERMETDLANGCISQTQIVGVIA